MQARVLPLISSAAGQPRLGREARGPGGRGCAGRPLAALSDPGDAHVSATLVLRVSDREAAAAQVIAAGEAAGGWFSSLGPDAVSLKIPRAKARALVQDARKLGEVEDRSFSREDLTATLGDLRGLLASREKVLGRYLEVLATASPKSVVSVEREVTGLVSEIESLEGQIRLLQHRADYADVTVSFRFRNRQAPARDGRSSFAWLNQLNVADLLDDLRAGRRSDRSAARAVAPEGFAPYRKTGRFQALSPDGVVYRVRSMRHKPKASLDFWKEALRERMVGAGYTLVREQDLEGSGGQPGVLLAFRDEIMEWIATRAEAQPQAAKVWLEMAKLSGDAEALAPRRDALLKALSLVDP